MRGIGKAILKAYLLLYYLYNRVRNALGLIRVKYGILDVFSHNNIYRCGFMTTKERLEDAKGYDNFRPDDVMICTYPKSGTVFTLGILSSIYKEYSSDDNSKPQASFKFIESRWPRLLRCIHGDFVGDKHLEDLDNVSSPRILLTHSLWSSLPPKVKEGNVKVIYCRRNPKDVVCSAFHYYKSMGYLLAETKLTDFVQWFTEGNVLYGSYFTHLKDWRPHHSQSHVLPLRYESMVADLKETVEQMVEFLDISLTPAQIERVVSANEFVSRKKAPLTNMPIYRKGVSGGWRSELTVQQNELLDEWIERETQGMQDVKLDYK